MQDLNIYLAGIDNMSEYDRIQRGYAIPVIVYDGLFYYSVEVYNYKAFEKYITININNDGYPISIPNLIISNNCSNSEIKNTIYYNYKSLYFQFIKHVNLINLNSCIAEFHENIIIGEENDKLCNIIKYYNNIFNVEIVKYKKNIDNNIIINYDANYNIHDNIELIKSLQNELYKRGYLEYFKPHYYLAITQMLML